MDILRVFGVSAVVINIACMIPYYLDILKGKTKPERTSWVIWAFLGVIYFTTSLAEGAKESLWFIGAQVLLPVGVILLSFRYHSGGVGRHDKIALFVAAAALVAWYFTGDVAIPLIVALVIDFTGLVLTFDKTWNAPTTETLAAWAFPILVGILAMLSVGRLDYILLAFPAYIMLAGLLMSSMIIYRRRVLVKQLVRKRR